MMILLLYSVVFGVNTGPNKDISPVNLEYSRLFSATALLKTKASFLLSYKKFSIAMNAQPVMKES